MKHLRTFENFENIPVAKFLLEEDQVDCNYFKQLGPNVISATNIQNVDNTQDLIFLIYEEQKVKY